MREIEKTEYIEDDSDDESEENISCSIYNFPVQIISLEKCENTLDYLKLSKS